ncbi:MAG: glycosyltransferase family 4 protein [Desulfuromonadaceae bacterium]
MKKIGLFLESRPSGGGTFQYNQLMLDAVAALPKDKFSVVIGYTSELWREYLKNYDLQSVHVPPGFWSRAVGLGWLLLGLPMAVWRKITPWFHPMAKALLLQQCDLWIFPSQDARSFQFPLPALVCIHDLMHLYERKFSESASGWEFLNRERTYYNICCWAQGVLVDSDVGKQQVHDSYGIDLNQLHVLPYIAPGYMQLKETPPGFDERYQLPKKFIFYPAQFWEHKNHKNLIKAIAQLINELPDLKLVLVGAKKNAYDSVVKLLRELGMTEDVCFLGYVPDSDMPELYRRAHLMVMPTYYGPTNIPPLEAFVAGCPVAISGIYGMPGQVGDAALLFNPNSVDEIADCIKRLWTDEMLCLELANKGKKHAALWGQIQFNAQLEEIIEQILHGA